MATNSIVTDIYQQFIDYFGEDNVDLQDYSRDTIEVYDSYLRDSLCSEDKVIMVHWPTVEVANEFDEKIEIWDLYSITIISNLGRLKTSPLFNRSTYDNVQWVSDYAHSHLPGINKSLPKIFRQSCLGTGPIRHTIDRLSNGNFRDLDIWNLYIWELDKYVHVESISGVPYRKIRNIGIGTNTTDGCLKDFNMVLTLSDIHNVPRKIIKEITALLLRENVLTFSYYRGKYIIGMPFDECVIKASNAFIAYYNSNKELRKAFPKQTLYDKGVMVDLLHLGQYFYVKNSSNVPLEAVINTELFTFKGNKVMLSLKNFNGEYTFCEIHALSINLLSYIIYNILKFINISYGRTDIINKEARVF